MFFIFKNEKVKLIFIFSTILFFINNNISLFFFIVFYFKVKSLINFSYLKKDYAKNYIY